MNDDKASIGNDQSIALPGLLAGVDTAPLE
jgi:hypothetical protein